MRIEKYKGSNHWGLYATDGSLICVTVYKKGALSVMQLIQSLMQQEEVQSHV
jgi:hypothetical protein